MYTIGTYLRVQLNNGAKVIGKVTFSSEDFLSLKPMGQTQIIFNAEFQVIEELTPVEVKELLLLGRTNNPVAIEV